MWVSCCFVHMRTDGIGYCAIKAMIPCRVGTGNYCLMGLQAMDDVKCGFSEPVIE